MSNGVDDHATADGSQFGRGYGRCFQPGTLTVGLMFPVEAFSGDPRMEGQESLAARAEQAGFAALWMRDVPLRDPSFGDVGQIYDTWVYAAWIAAQTRDIALVTGAAILPLRHPLHVAKAAASLDRLTDGRFVLGVASGDRPAEFQAFGKEWSARSEAFRHAFEYVRYAFDGQGGHADPLLGSMPSFLDTLPKPGSCLPIMVVGSAQQSIDWIAGNADAWATYPRPAAQQALLVEAWRARTAGFKPFAQSLYIDLDEKPGLPPVAIHLGFRSGRSFLIEHLEELRALGVNHVVLNLKYGRRDARDVVEELAADVLPQLARGPQAQLELPQNAKGRTIT